GKLARTDHAAAFPGQRAVDRDVIGAAQQFIELDLLCPARGDLFTREIGIVGHDLHAEQAFAELGDAAADIADSDDAGGSALHFGAHQIIAIDATLAAQRTVGLDDAFG